MTAPRKAEWVRLACMRRYHLDVETGCEGVARVPCRYCRTEPGEVVVHHFDMATGKLIETRRYRDLAELIKRSEREGRGARQ